MPLCGLHSCTLFFSTRLSSRTGSARLSSLNDMHGAHALASIWTSAVWAERRCAARGRWWRLCGYWGGRSGVW